MKNFLKALKFELNSIFGGMKYVLLVFAVILIVFVLIPSYHDGDYMTALGVYLTFGSMALIVLIVSSVKAFITSKEDKKEGN